jgi:hypothetical protein
MRSAVKSKNPSIEGFNQGRKTLIEGFDFSIHPVRRAMMVELKMVILHKYQAVSGATAIQPFSFIE